MLPLRLDLQGFLTYRCRETLDFRADWLWAITGKNGAGKSALFDAITFALYGVYRGGASSEERLIAHGCASLRVAYDFAVGSELFRVERTIERKVGRKKTTYAKTWQAYAIDLADPPNIVAEIPDSNTATKLESWVAEKTGLKYEAFCACVLLTQGEATKFITASAGSRQQVLMQLLDLRQYERLTSAAKARRDRLKGELDANEKDLQGLEGVTPEAKSAAEAVVSGLTDELAHLDIQIETQVIVREHAAEFVRLQDELSEKREALGQARDLLGDAKQIEAEAAERAELTEILPALEEALGHLQDERLARDAEREARVTAGALEIEALEKERDRLRAEVGDAERARDLAHIAAEVAWKAADELRPAAEAAVELHELDEAIAAAELELLGLRESLLERSAVTADVRLREEAVVVAPLLGIIASAREDAGKAERDLNEFESSLPQLRSDAEKRRARASELRAEEVKVQSLAAERRRAHAAADAAAGRDREDLASRIAAGEEGICSRCGQKVDADHVQREMLALQGQLSQHEREAEEADGLAREAEERVNVLRDEAQAAEGAVAEAALAVRRVEDSRDACIGIRDQALGRARAAMAQLPPGVQARHRATPGYPGAEDVKEAVQLAAGLDAARGQLADLDDAAVRASGLEGGVAEQRRRADDLRARFGPEILATAVAVRAVHSEEAQRIELEKEETRAEAARIRAAADASEQLLDSAKAERQRLLDDAAEQDARARTAASTAAALVRGLEPRWREIVASEAQLARELPNLTARHDQLVGAEGRLAALELARRSADALEEHVRVREMEIERVPAEHRVPVEEAEGVLTGLKDLRGERQGLHSLQVAEVTRIAEALARVERLRVDRASLEQRHEDAGTLQKWFGRNGLQAALVQEAQVEIGRAANDYLSRISEGWLGLVFEATQDALEIRVTDLSSGDEPVDVALVSGSQKFRVAVAVALAIGQYRGGASRDIRSVIIDEGFGSLDVDGRREMIDQLRGLGTVLERVILVSHQEEFQEAFANGYHIEKVNRTSRALRRGGSAAAAVAVAMGAPAAVAVGVAAGTASAVEPVRPELN